MLSTKTIPVKDRLIVALDVPDKERALALVEELGDAVGFYKLGLELFMSGSYFELLAALRARDKKIFADLKFFDIPQTVASAVRQLKMHEPEFATVHGNDAILRAACEAKGRMKLLAVTVLTSLDEGDLEALGFTVDAETLVLSRARRALALGCDGVVSSGLEAERLRSELGEKLLIVVPGIRPIANRETDDQKRAVDIEDAFRKGADHIVMGRPIRTAESPRKAAEDIQRRIETLFKA